MSGIADRTPIAKCWKCGCWIRPGDEYEEERHFHTCSDCFGGKE